MIIGLKRERMSVNHREWHMVSKGINVNTGHEMFRAFLPIQRLFPYLTSFYWQGLGFCKVRS